MSVLKKFSITEEKLHQLKEQFPNLGKNSDVGKFAVEIAKLYFQQKNSMATFPPSRDVDLYVEIDGVKTPYEIKGTTDKTIAWNKLKVSSRNCYNKLVNEDMPIMRITNIGEQDMNIYFLKYNEDFTLKSEDRWSVKEIK